MDCCPYSTAKFCSVWVAGATVARPVLAGEFSKRLSGLITQQGQALVKVAATSSVCMAPGFLGMWMLAEC